MSYTNDTFIHATFDSTPIIEYKAAIAILPDDLGTEQTLVNGVFGKALQLEETLSCYTPQDISVAFGMGFWLKSVNPGMVLNPISNEFESLRMPLFIKGSVSLVSNTYIPSASLLVYEKTNDDGTNQLVIYLKGSSTVTATSSSYSTGQFHHFWINYDGGSNTLDLYIDAVLDTGLTKIGTIPTVLIATSDPFNINDLAPGPSYAVARNSGVIDDLVMFFTTKTISEIIRIVNMGAIYIADSDYSNAEEVDQILLFDDPSEVKVNAITSNRGNVYVARSDGKVLRGNHSVWESRRDFNDNRELNYVTVVKKSDDNTISIENGVLTIVNNIIRI